jgi:hypothetical protein
LGTVDLVTYASPHIQDRAASRQARRIEFLFNPTDVTRLLTSLPHLSGVLGDPNREGEPAASLSGVRKSPRELYRVLGNSHYEHLAQLLESLDELGFREGAPCPSRRS